MNGLGSVVERFAERRVVVLGEAMLDTYLVGRAERIGREAPVPIVALGERRDEPGGAANAAMNVATLGARTSFVSLVGDDDEGRRIVSALTAAGVDTAGVIEVTGRSTLAKTRVSAGDHMLVRFDAGSTDAVAGRVERELIVRLRRSIGDADLLIVSDYDYGVVGDPVLAALAELRATSTALLVVDARDLRRYRSLRPDLVKPNYQEVLRLLGEPDARDRSSRVGQVEPHAERVLRLTGARVAAITFDTDGALVVERGEGAYRTYARPVSDSRAAGAGDTYAAVLGLALASRAEVPAAAELAAAAAAIVVEKEGTARCTAEELAAHVREVAKRAVSLDELVESVAAHRRSGRRIVFTNGCFDILHRGHVTYLTRAKALGDVLVVGVNADASVARLKGPGRPVNQLDDRLAVLEALSCVDHVIAFEEETPAPLIERLRPDVYTKGGDYRVETLPEAPVVSGYGGRIEILPFLADRSTTGLIERVRRSATRPPVPLSAPAPSGSAATRGPATAAARVPARRRRPKERVSGERG